MNQQIIELMDDMHLKNKDIFKQYYDAMSNNNVSLSQQILSTNPEINNQIFTSENINPIITGINDRELRPKTDIDYYLNQLESDFQEMINNTVVREVFDKTTQYYPHNLVYYQEKGYYTLLKPPIGTLPTDSNYWLEYDIRGLKGYGGFYNINFKYDWNATTQYHAGDMVIFQNKLWWAVIDNINYAPNLDHLPWALSMLPLMPIKTPIQRAEPSGYSMGDFWFRIIQGDDIISTAWVVKAANPSPTYAISAVSIGTNIYCIGGDSPRIMPTRTNQCYDTITNTWSSKAPLSEDRAGLGCFVIGNNIYACGGQLTQSRLITNQVDIYNSESNTWSIGTPMPEAGILRGTSYNGIGYLVSGTTNYGISTTHCYSFNPTTNKWSSIADMITKRIWAAVSAINGKIYCIGGATDTSQMLNINEVYDIATNTWSTLAPMPTTRSFCSSFDKDNIIYVLGGIDKNFYSLSLNEAYDINSNTWKEKMPMNYPRNSLSTLTVGEKGYAVGGFTIQLSRIVPYIEEYTFDSTLIDFEMIIDTSLPIIIQNQIITESGNNIITEYGDDVIPENSVTTITNKTVSIPMVQNGMYNYWIDWGDGFTSTQITSYDDIAATHTYAQDGEYTIKLTGTLSQLQFTGAIASFLTQVTECTLSFSNINSMFKNCINLTSIPDGIFSESLNISSANYTFNNCASLNIIPVGLFSNNVNITSFNGTFENSGLTTIPTGLFSGNNLVKTFISTFQDCVSLVSIPIDLFTNNPNVTSFYSTFARCTNLTNIPNNLFTNNPVVADYKYTFLQCAKLTSIPNNLFGNASVSVIQFDNMFYNINGIKQIPSGIFSNATSVTSYNGIFFNSGITVIPDNCFNGNNATWENAFPIDNITAIGDNSLNGLAITSDMFKNKTSLLTIGNDSFWSNSITTIINSPTNLFNGATKLSTVGNINLKGVTSNVDLTNMFSECTSLAILSGFKYNNSEPSLANNISFTSCPLTYQSLINISNSLVTNTPSTTKNLTLGTTNLAKLTDVEKLTIINKYWNLPGYTINITSQIAQNLVLALKGYAGLSTTMYQETSLYYYVRLYNTTTTANIGWYAVEKSTGYVYNYDSVPQYEYYIATANTLSEEGLIKNYYWVPKGTENDTIGTILKNKLSEFNNANVVSIQIGQSISQLVNNTGLENVQDLSHLCENFTYLKRFIVIGGSNSIVENMSYMFSGCTSLLSIDLGNLNSSNVTIMNSMFYNCKAMIDWSFLNNLSTSAVTDMSFMFGDCSKLTTMPSINMNSVTQAPDMFSATSITTIKPNIIGSNLINASRMFANNSKLTTLPSDYTTIFGNNTKLTDVSYLFSGCSKLANVGEQPINQIQHTEYTEYTFNATKAANQILGKCPNITNASYMFSGTKIGDIPIGVFYNNPNLTNISYAFKGCTSLIMSAGGNTVGVFQTYNNLLKNNTKLTTIAGLFQGCTSLEWFGIDTDEGTDAFSSLTNLEDASYLYDGSGIGDMLFGFGFPINSTKLKDISYALRGCPIYYMPVWAKNTAASTFPALQKCEGLFYNCSSIGESDYGTTQQNALPFINSVTGLSSFVSGKGAFYNCTNIKDYSSIPDVWKQQS